MSELVAVVYICILIFEERVEKKVSGNSIYAFFNPEVSSSTFTLFLPSKEDSLG